ncbi:MAG TPA: methyl-accepting chemotaxis protein, partial [Blastocatellia bacterium]|nr:methyl-accepting chemotaxis protein [Blastocatellia bacterium]
DAIEASNREVAKVGASINEVNHTINTLGEKAESIWKIVETIDEIAEQTNLLALNAAIESARAGEHGLGFAVVADEVRKLAERSAHSTHEISELLDHIRREARLAVEQMTRSTKVVEDYMQEKRVSDALLEVTTAIDQIVTATRHIEQATKDQTCGADEISHAMSSLNILTKEVSAATSEQTVGASQIVLAMDNLADVVQQSSNMSGSLESSAIELSEQVERLQATMRRFKTGSVSTPAAAHSKKAAEVRV